MNTVKGNAVNFILSRASRFSYWPVRGYKVVAVIDGRSVEFDFADQGRHLAALAEAAGWTWMVGGLWLKRPPDRSVFMGDSIHAGMRPSVVRVLGGQPGPCCPF